jgi:hypothetical protein
MQKRAKAKTLKPQRGHAESATRATSGVSRGQTVGLAVIAVAALVMLGQSWRRWPDPIIDFGRELYVPWRLAEGETLYRDLAYFNGPLSPYVNAGWFRLFGVSLRVLVFANISVTSALLALLYVLLSQVGSRMSAFLACLTFVLVFGFSRYTVVGNYNYVCPYSHEITHGLLLSLAALWFVGRYARGRRVRDAGLCGLCVGLASLTKPEIFLAAAPSAAVGIGLALYAQREPRERALAAGSAFLAALVVPSVAAVALLSLAMPTAMAIRGTLGGMGWLFSPEITSLPFYRNFMGTDHLAENLATLLTMSAWYAALFGVPAALGLLKWQTRRRAFGACVGCFAMIVLAFLWHPDKVPLIDIMRPVPTVMLLALGVLITVYVRRRDPAARGQLVLPIAMVLFALLVLAKFLLFVRHSSYGFALAMPATLLLVVLLWDWAPRAIERRGGNCLPLRGATLAVLLAFVTLCGVISSQRLASEIVPVGSGADALWTDSRGLEVNRVMDDIRRLAPDDATLAVIPEGIMLNYLLRRTNPTPYISLMPVEVLMFGEERILDAWRQRPPDFVVLTDQSTSDYGFASFGDYAGRLANFLRSNYAVVARGPRDGGPWHALLMKRNDAAATAPDSDLLSIERLRGT